MEGYTLSKLKVTDRNFILPFKLSPQLLYQGDTWEGRIYRFENTSDRPVSFEAAHFALPEDNLQETEDALSMLKPILSLMAAPKDGTNDLENSLLEQALKAAWTSSGRNASISYVADFLKRHENQTARLLGQKLFPYTKDGVYGRFFEGPATVDLSNPLVVIELEELKERKDLQEVIVQMMIVQITNKLY